MRGRDDERKQRRSFHSAPDGWLATLLRYGEEPPKYALSRTPTKKSGVVAAQSVPPGASWCWFSFWSWQAACLLPALLFASHDSDQSYLDDMGARFDSVFLLGELGDVDNDAVQDFGAVCRMKSSENLLASRAAFVLYSGNTLQPLVRVELPLESTDPHKCFAVDDYDKDGVLDVAICSRETALYSARTGTQLKSLPFFSEVVCRISDVDEDGVEELIVIVENSVGNRTAVYRSADNVLDFSRFGENVGRTSAVGDVDHDGVTDIMPSTPEAGALSVLSGATGKALLSIRLPSAEFEGGSQFWGVGVVAGSELEKVPSVVLFEEDINDAFAISLCAFSIKDGRLRWRRVLFSPDETTSLIGGRFAIDQRANLSPTELGIVGVFSRVSDKGFALNGVECLWVSCETGVERWRVRLGEFQEPGRRLAFVGDRDDDGLPEVVVSAFRDERRASEQTEAVRQFFGGAVFVVGSKGKILQRIDR